MPRRKEGLRSLLFWMQILQIKMQWNVFNMDTDGTEQDVHMTEFIIIIIIIIITITITVTVTITITITITIKITITITIIIIIIIINQSLLRRLPSQYVVFKEVLIKLKKLITICTEELTIN